MEVCGECHGSGVLVDDAGDEHTCLECEGAGTSGNPDPDDVAAATVLGQWQAIADAIGSLREWLGYDPADTAAIEMALTIVEPLLPPPVPAVDLEADGLWDAHTDAYYPVRGQLGALCRRHGLIAPAEIIENN